MTKLISLEVRNFKSLADVQMKFTHLTCLIGMNGAGKSSTLQVLDFVSQLMRGRITEWLEHREWTASDLHCKLTGDSNIEIEALLELNDGSFLTWEAFFNRRELRCTYERFRRSGEPLLIVRSGRFFIENVASVSDISLEYEGSLLAHLKRLPESVVGSSLKEVRDFIRGIQSLELLSPNLMRKRARTTDKDIGSGGEKLSAFLSTLKGDAHAALLKMMRNFYPTATDFKISNLKSGVKKLTVFERFGTQTIETEARHLNDGLLRILAILAKTQTTPTMLLLDEIENGMNQEIVDQLVKVLLDAPGQIVVTTHSPLVLNYLPDDIARNSIQFVYKSPDGTTHIRPFFQTPRIAEKLEVMGPGDAFVDTNLMLLTEECVALDADEAKRDAQFEDSLEKYKAKMASEHKDTP